MHLLGHHFSVNVLISINNVNQRLYVLYYILLKFENLAFVTCFINLHCPVLYMLFMELTECLVS